MSNAFEVLKQKTLELDQNDPLKHIRELFTLPNDHIYFCNNSLGLPAKQVSSKVQKQLQQWGNEGVEGWFKGEDNWYASMDAPLRKPLARLLGAKYSEVVVMNSLTVNLHLLLVSFYQPTLQRFKILIDAPTFPSDLYAIQSHIKYHGLDPKKCLKIVEPRLGEHLLRMEDIHKVLDEEGDSIALVFLNPVNFLTGQVLDMESLTKKAKSKGCTVGFDLAHAAGNISLALHQLRVDFAVGCTYKYLCSGPGGPGFAYVHESHHQSNLPRFTGWWGNDPKTRFQMQLQPEFIPHDGAYSWQVSTPSILAMTPLIASLEAYEEAGIDNLRKKSELQTDLLLRLLNCFPKRCVEIISPENSKERGSQISLLILQDAEKFLQVLQERKVVCDFRPPNIIRVTPSPLYNTFYEIYQFVDRIKELL